MDVGAAKRVEAAAVGAPGRGDGAPPKASGPDAVRPFAGLLARIRGASNGRGLGAGKTRAKGVAEAGGGPARAGWSFAAGSLASQGSAGGALGERAELGCGPQGASRRAHDADEEADAKADADARAAHGGTDVDSLDPAMRRAAQLAPPAPFASPAAARPGDASNEPVLRARSLEELLPALVRRIAWSGDRHRGTVRLELGAGAYAGTTLVVHADGGRVRVETFGDEGADLDRLRQRLDARLRGHGLDVESVT